MRRSACTTPDPASVRRPRAPRTRTASASTPAGRRSTTASTSATPGPFVVFSLLKRFLEHEGYDADARRQRHRRQRQDLRRGARRGRPERASSRREMTAAYCADTDLLGLGRPDHEPLASRDDRADRRPHRGARSTRGHAYERDGDVYFRVRTRPALRRALAPRRRRRWTRGRASKAPTCKEDPLDFALWKAEKEGEDTAWDVALGPRPARLAHRVLGDGRGAARRRLRDPRRRHRTSSSRTTRTRRRRRAAARGAELAQIWMHNGMLQLGGEKMAKSVGNIELLAEAVERWGRDTLVLFFATGHYRQPIQYTDDALDAGAQHASRASARRPGALVARRLARATSRRCATRSSTRWPTTSTRPRALAPLLRRGCARPTAREGVRATRTCARCSASSASRTCSRRGREPGAEDLDAARAPPGGARGEGLRRGRPAARRAARARLGGPRHAGRRRARRARAVSAAPPRQGRAVRAATSSTAATRSTRRCGPGGGGSTGSGRPRAPRRSRGSRACA